MEEIRIDCRRERTKEEQEAGLKDVQNNFKFNHTMPGTEEYTKIMHELFHNQIGEKSIVNAPLTVVVPKNVHIGKNVVVMNGSLMMAAGGLTIEDDVMVAANVQLITNNHDPYERNIITCKPVKICKGAWIGAGATILPGVTVGEYAIVGAASVVTKNVPAYGVAVGNPAKVIKTLDKEKFKKWVKIFINYKVIKNLVIIYYSK